MYWEDAPSSLYEEVEPSWWFWAVGDGYSVYEQSWAGHHWDNDGNGEDRKCPRCAREDRADSCDLPVRRIQGDTGWEGGALVPVWDWVLDPVWGWAWAMVLAPAWVEAWESVDKKFEMAMPAGQRDTECKQTC